jgi:hypothetical protein
MCPFEHAGRSGKNWQAKHLTGDVCKRGLNGNLNTVQLMFFLLTSIAFNYCDNECNEHFDKKRTTVTANTGP